MDRLRVRAPGRVNLIGEHTDYNDGFVLPAAIDLEVQLDVELTGRRWVDVSSDADAAVARFSIDAANRRQSDWTDYVAGVCWSLVDGGWPVGGFEGGLTSSLPAQAGLSSSAALELCAAWALITAGGRARGAVDRLALARLCQRAENEFVGVRCGLMDQFAVSCGVAGHALLLDCRSLDYRAIRLPSDIALVIVDTGARRRLQASEYNARRADCERGVAVLAGRGEDVRSLRDASVEMLDRARPALGEATYRRCRHVVDENARTLAAAAALETADRLTLHELFAASHASLRDMYEVSSPELDAAVAVAAVVPGVIATRMTGAGFGGSTINLVEADAVTTLREAIARDYVPRTGLPARVYETQAADGAGIAAID